MKTPRELGYRFPAEWERHAATWLAWPRNPKTWPDHFEPIPAVWAELVTVLSQFEPVHILAGGEPIASQAHAMVGHLPNVVLHDIPTNDAWARDHGPMFLVGPPGSQPALVDWKYNAWGGKYPPFDDDDRVPSRIAAIQDRLRFEPGIFLEGGAVDGNGRGTILTTERCVLNPNRNPGMTRADLERYLADYCGVKKVIWLGGDLAGDDTDGHIDQLVRFVGPSTVVTALERNPDDENYASLQENFEQLQRETDQDGRPLEVIPLPMPGPKYQDDCRMPACYANFYIANGVVIVPQFDDPADREAIDVLARVFPDRKVIGLRAVDLVWGLGAYHCITQQEPAVD